MASPTTRFEHKQLQAAHLLAQGHTQAYVASQVGVTRETISNWKNHSANFQVELEAAKKLVRSRIRRDARSVVDAAIKSAAEDLRTSSKPLRRRMTWRIIDAIADADVAKQPQA